jgi:hypothetical protein
MIVPPQNDCLQILFVTLNETNQIGGKELQKFKYLTGQTLKHRIKNLLNKCMGYSKKKNPIVQFGLLNSWGAYICSELVNYGAYEFKLHGILWVDAGRDIETSRHLLQTLLTDLKINGWNLLS